MNRFLLFVMLLGGVLSAHAQCDTCIPDTSCVLSPAYPTMCPGSLPDASAGQFYETDITFYTPHEFFEVENGVDVVFNQVTIIGTTGLPFGMNVEMNEPTGIYQPAISEHGCARICGTPLSPGTYNININFVAAVYVPAFGIEVNQNQSFQLELTVLPGTGENTSFTYDVNIGCDSLFVNFEALLNADPTPTSWLWDFGNGQTSDLQVPPTQFYGDTGTYEVTLETQFLEYIITHVSVNSVNDNWCGDIEEPTCDGFFGLLPDLFFQIRDAGGNLLFQSNVVDDVLAASWSELSIVAANPPYTIQIWDEDAVSSNDDLGTFSFNITGEGTINFSGAGGTSGSLTVSSQVGNTFFDSEIITVFPSSKPLLEFDENTNWLSVVADSTIISYNWYLNGVLITGETGSQIQATTPGEYHVVAQNGFGCSSASDVFIVCPSVEITYNAQNGIISSVSNYSSYQWYFQDEPVLGATQSFLIVSDYGWYYLVVEAGFGCTITSTPMLVCPSVEISVSADGSTLSVPEGFASYMWVKGGVPVPGADGPIFEPTSGGTYWVVVTTDYGCTISTPTFISTVSVEEHTLNANHFALYPNPAVDGFNLRSTSALNSDVEVVLTDLSGRMVRHFGTHNANQLSYQYFDVTGLSSGQYLLMLSDGKKPVSLRVMIR